MKGYCRGKFVAGLGVLVAGAFVMTVVHLPHRQELTVSQNSLALFFKIRTDWHIAWTVLAAGLIISVATILIVEAFVGRGEKEEVQ